MGKVEVTNSVPTGNCFIINGRGWAGNLSGGRVEGFEVEMYLASEMAGSGAESTGQASD